MKKKPNQEASNPETKKTRILTASRPEILNALRAFCFEFADPALTDDEHVIYGFANDLTLPADGNDCCVVTPIAQRRSGTNIERYPEGEEVQELLEHVELDVQIDCYSNNEFDALDRAATYETIGRSAIGVKFFERFNIGLLYTDSSQNLSSVLDSDRYVSRWTLTLHLSYWKTVKLGQDFFKTITIDVANVDVKFKP